MVFETLNRLRWKGGLDEAEIVITDRGSPGDRKVVKGSQVSLIKRGYFYFIEDKSEIYIPNHRVLKIRVRGETLWKKAAKKGT